MAFDGNIWVKLRRPLSDWEQAQQVSVKAPISKEAGPEHTVFELNDIFLETSDVTFLERGVMTWGGLWSLAGAFMTLHFCIWAFITPPPGVHGGDLVAAYLAIACVFVVGLGLLGGTLWALHLENFTCTRRPIRFNRQTRMVHAYRGAGSKGVISVAWEKAYFFIEKRSPDAITRANPYVLRCHVLDDHANVVQSFAIGPRLLAYGDENSVGGAASIGRLKSRLEFIRRYMDGGPSAVTVEEFLPTTTTYASARWIATCDDKVLIAQGHGGMVRRTSTIGFLQSIFIWVSWKTCKAPVWPDAVRKSFDKQVLANSATEV